MRRLEDLDTTPGYNTDLMDYRSLEDLVSLDEGPEQTGINEDAEVGIRPDGTRVYVKNADSRGDDMVQSHIAADIFGDHSPIKSPEIAYDDVYGKILIEELPGDRTIEFRGTYEGPLHRAAAGKMLMGDCDYAGNFLTTENSVIPIDYDMTGRDMITVKMTMKTAMQDKLDEDLLHREASQLANQVDIAALEEEMRNESYLMEEWSSEGEIRDPEAWEGLFMGSIDNILDNVKAFQY